MSSSSASGSKIRVDVTKAQTLREHSRLQSLSESLRHKEDLHELGRLRHEQFVNVLREGSGAEIRNAILESRREIDQHIKLGRLTKASSDLALEFQQLSETYLKQTQLMEKLQPLIASMKSRLGCKADPGVKKKYDHAIEQSKKLPAIIDELAERLIKLYGRLETQVRNDQATEHELTQTLERCLHYLPTQERGAIMVNATQKCKQATIDQRIAFYTHLIEHLTRRIPAIREEEINYHLEEAKSCAGKRQFQQGLFHLDQVFKFDRKHIQGHRLRADIYQDMGNRVAYVCELRMITKIDLCEGRDFFTLAEIVLSNNQLEEGYTLLEQAVDKDPNIKYLERLGDVACRLNRWYRAAQLYRTILDQMPYLARVMHKYGWALLEDGHEEEAFDLLRQAIELEDNNSHSRVCVGRMYRKFSLFDEAQESFRRGVELDSRNPEAYYWWGLLLYDHGDFENACPKAAQSVELDSRRVRNRILLAKCQSALRRHTQGLETLEPSLSAPIPSVDLLLTYSEICRYGHQVDRALDVLGQFLRRFPRQPQIRSEYGLLLALAQRTREAQDYLEPVGANWPASSS